MNLFEVPGEGGCQEVRFSQPSLLSLADNALLQITPPQNSAVLLALHHPVRHQDRRPNVHPPRLDLRRPALRAFFCKEGLRRRCC